MKGSKRSEKEFLESLLDRKCIVALPVSENIILKHEAEYTASGEIMPVMDAQDPSYSLS